MPKPGALLVVMSLLSFIVSAQGFENIAGGELYFSCPAGEALVELESEVIFSPPEGITADRIWRFSCAPVSTYTPHR